MNLEVLDADARSVEVILERLVLTVVLVWIPRRSIRLEIDEIEGVWCQWEVEA
jgi:hypothetical protein